MILQARRYIGDGTIIGLSRGFAACRTGSSESRFELDMSQVPFLRVGQICLLAMYCMWVRGQLRNSSIMGLPPESDLFHYLQRIDFFKYLGVEVEESFCRHDSDTFVEIREIINDESNTANDIPAKFRRIVEATSQLDGSVVSAVDRSFGEILDNVLTHSHTRIPGIAIAQFYPREHYIEFCVADCGIGIPQSLKKNSAYEGLSSCELLAQAFEYGVGENIFGANKSDEGYGCGYGLAFASKLARVSKGGLWAICNDDAVHIGEAGLKRIEGCWFPGTIVCMRVPSDIVLSESDLDLDGGGSSRRPFYWDDKGNELEDFCEDAILW